MGHIKIGDIVYSTKIRPYERMTVKKSEVKIEKDKNGRKVTKTKYTGEYPDGSFAVFYGFNINKSVFKAPESIGQISLNDIFKEEME